MKGKACKTCDRGYCGREYGTIMCNLTATLHDGNDVACKRWRLKEGCLRYICEQAVEKARKKHPKFITLPDASREHAVATAAGNMARQIKADLERASTANCYRDCQLEMVLKGELYEFLEAFHHGDFEHAMEEAADVVAVLFRALNGEGRRG